MYPCLICNILYCSGSVWIELIHPNYVPLEIDDVIWCQLYKSHEDHDVANWRFWVPHVLCLFFDCTICRVGVISGLNFVLDSSSRVDYICKPNATLNYAYNSNSKYKYYESRVPEYKYWYQVPTNNRWCACSDAWRRNCGVLGGSHYLASCISSNAATHNMTSIRLYYTVTVLQVPSTTPESRSSLIIMTYCHILLLASTMKAPRIPIYFGT